MLTPQPAATDNEGPDAHRPIRSPHRARVRFVSHAEWDLLKRHTAAHLHDHATAPRDYADPASASAEKAPPKEVTEPHYFSGNYPRQTGE